MKRPEKPVKKWTSLIEAMQKMAFYGDRSNYVGKAPCPRCFGRGDEIAPDSFCDPCEGYRHADRIKCQRCNGEGTISVSDFLKSVYQPALREYRLAMEKYREGMRTYRSIKSKLTDKERKFLDL